MPRVPTRVVVVEDSVTQRAFLRRSLEADGDIVVVGEAATAASAVAAVVRGEPDVVTVDLDIPGGGQSAIERILRATPCAILVLSGQIENARSRAATTALEAGAVSVLAKPRRWDAGAEADLRRKVRSLRSVRPTVWRDILPSSDPVVIPPRPVAATTTATRMSRYVATSVGQTASSGHSAGGAVAGTDVPVVAIGASTGGPAAVSRVLRGLRGVDAPVLVVQHIDSQAVDGLALWLERTSGWPVAVAETGETLRRGLVTLGPSGRHLTIDANLRIALADSPVAAHMPSVDQLFTSLAVHHGARTAAALLTGMGRDGASGLLALRRAGAYTVCQDEASSVVYGMAKAAVDMGAPRRVVPLDDIAWVLSRAAKGMGL